VVIRFVIGRRFCSPTIPFELYQDLSLESIHSLAYIHLFVEIYIFGTAVQIEVIAWTVISTMKVERQTIS
jgi:hypothetical protein